MLPTSGNIQISESVIYSPPAGKKGIIKNIRIANNTIAAYDIKVTQIIPNSLNGKILIDFSFSQWRLVNDNTEYVIFPGEQILAKASVNTVTFILNGEEVDV